MLDSVLQTVSPILDEILEGLRKPQKTLPSKLFYDAEGCRLFEEITRLPEYYVTRTEKALLARIVPELPRLPGSSLVEYGGSDEAKALMLLDQIGASTYVPIDIASNALHAMTDRLRTTRPDITVCAVVTDFLQPFTLPARADRRSMFGFFPGSTIGNLDPLAAGKFLRQARGTLGPGANFLVGVDLRKDAAILLPAYDDRQGVTAAFNRNLLMNVNRLIGTRFDPLSFAHQARWTAHLSRIEMHLVSRGPQTVDVAGVRVDFADGESIHTENSYKYSIESFLAIARSSGWCSRAIWTDEAEMFSLHLLTTSETEA